MYYTVGIDLGGTNIAAGICDENLNIVIKGSVPTMADRDPELIVKDMAALVDDLIEKSGIAHSDISYVGIAAPGSINPETGTVEYSNNIRMFDFPICDIFRKYSPLKEIYIANDANAAALGEALAGAAKGAGVAVMITLGTGVGGGVIMNGKIFAGGLNHSGTELGHTVLVSGGRQCTCGRRGCWEAYSSATALSKMTKEKMLELELKGIESKMHGKARADGSVSARVPFTAMKEGDPYGKEVCDEYIRYLAEGITNMINIFQPHILCIGGGVCNEKEHLTVPLNEIVERDQYTRTNKVKTKIVTATLGNDAGIIGAASLGR
jgi:glucokinase